VQSIIAMELPAAEARALVQAPCGAIFCSLYHPITDKINGVFLWPPEVRGLEPADRYLLYGENNMN
jgi:hypothetical protein